MRTTLRLVAMIGALAIMAGAPAHTAQTLRDTKIMSQKGSPACRAACERCNSTGSSLPCSRCRACS
jgi:hypothetical protein